MEVSEYLVGSPAFKARPVRSPVCVCVRHGTTAGRLRPCSSVRERWYRVPVGVPGVATPTKRQWGSRVHHPRDPEWRVLLSQHEPGLVAMGTGPHETIAAPRRTTTRPTTGPDSAVRGSSRAPGPGPVDLCAVILQIVSLLGVERPGRIIDRQVPPTHNLGGQLGRDE